MSATRWLRVSYCGNRLMHNHADARYFADLKPLPPEDAGKSNATVDPGPGERSKSKTGEWLRGGKYAEEKFVRR